MLGDTAFNMRCPDIKPWSDEIETYQLVIQSIRGKPTQASHAAMSIKHCCDPEVGYAVPGSSWILPYLTLRRWFDDDV
jgi:hypothetical protein